MLNTRLFIMTQPRKHIHWSPSALPPAFILLLSLVVIAQNHCCTNAKCPPEIVPSSEMITSYCTSGYAVQFYNYTCFNKFGKPTCLGSIEKRCPPSVVTNLDELSNYCIAGYQGDHDEYNCGDGEGGILNFCNSTIATDTTNDFFCSHFGDLVGDSDDENVSSSSSISISNSMEEEEDDNNIIAKNFDCPPATVSSYEQVALFCGDRMQSGNVYECYESQRGPSS